MVSQFYKDWAPYGFGDSMEDFSTTQPFVIDYRKAVSPERPAVVVAIDVAKRIYEENGPLTLMVSGGVDSQAMAYAFKLSGVPFRCMTAIYNDRINSYDVEGSFYRQHGIDVEEIDIDLIAFHENDLVDWAIRYQNNSPHFLSHLYIASHLPGTVISAGCILHWNNIGTMNYSTFCFGRYSEVSGQPVLGFFFNHDPELVGANLAVTVPNELDGYDRKVAAYRAAGFPVHRQIKKMHGFEKLKERYDDRKIDVRTRLRYRSKLSSRPYDLLFRYPLHDLVPYSEAGRTLYPERDK